VVRAATVLFWLSLAFAFIMAVIPMPPKTPLDQLGDKFAHILAFATLAGLAMLAFGREARWQIVERLCFLGAAIEVIQSVDWLSRTCDLRDWMADCLAVVVVVLIAGLLVPPRTEPGRSPV
jgi:VanZ family protein